MSSVVFPPGWFQLGRVWPYPSVYPEWKTPVTGDVLLMGWVAAFFALLLPFYLVIPASINRLSRFLRVTFLLLLGLAIMLCNFGQEWEVGSVKTKTQYRAGTAEVIQADLGVKLGLRSVNITLKGKPEHENSSLAGETIDYNERFTWAWAQGRPGFGPFAGQIQRDFRAAQYRGAPYPILWVAEYFTFDGEGIRFGRYYRISGWYAHIFVWAAFPMWLVTIFLFKMIVRYASISLAITGILMLIPAIIWSSNRNPIELQIPFEDGILRTNFGWCWYLALFTGIICIVVGGVLFFISRRHNDKLSEFFRTNPWEILDVCEEIFEEKLSPVADNEMEMENTNATKVLKRQVTMRVRGASSHFQATKHFEMPSVSESRRSSQNLLLTSSVSPTQRSRGDTISIAFEEEEEEDGNHESSLPTTSRGSQGQQYHRRSHRPQRNLHLSQNDSTNDDDDTDLDDRVFESPRPQPHGSPNLSPNRQEF